MLTGCGQDKSVNTGIKVEDKKVLIFIEPCLGYVMSLNSFRPLNCEVKNGELWITDELSKQITIPALAAEVELAKEKPALRNARKANSFSKMNP